MQYWMGGGPAGYDQSQQSYYGMPPPQTSNPSGPGVGGFAGYSGQQQPQPQQ